ncbi:MBL fold metallo-hydrolase [Cellulomonas palmilytica]|uniref:MBL fold metallo-hydrolase n=1 Tax=Cellulomonas palmilytica TaxID=2608402 RepID=UPI001F17F441|nr:MBL fold metallo-hydrolase [Cellulomonas palmilytica]UJP38994.1 MBL fold metallo-hydrolase [Cellulomonas palmilytica]
MTLRLTRWGHSCVRLDDDRRHLLIDPGSFCALDDALDGAQAILVTHEHADHLAVDRVAEAVRGGIPLWGPAPAVALLREADAPQDLLHVVSGGDHVEAAGFSVRVLGEWHAVIHPDIPRIPNVAYLVEGVLHPGDAHVQPTDRPDVHLLPISGPWFTLTEAVDRARDVGARRIVPIHDGLLNERGLGLLHTLVGRLVRGSELVALATGESVELANQEVTS